jgi:hypothetical protein
MSSSAKRIGGDWVENTDESTGRKYYANLTTKVRAARKGEGCNDGSC